MWKLSGRLGNSMFQYAYLYSQARKGRIPDVYLQGEKYFGGCEDEIKLLYGQGIGRIDQVAIHVRRGDYVDNPFYVDLMETDYYEKAMAEFPNESFLVFSDDIEWCKRQPIFKRCDFSEGNDEVTDMNLMASCKGVIIANSSFSWWGGYLSNGKVIAPSYDKWYCDGNRKRTIIPLQWQQI
jgi:glycosyl transferase family 11